MCFLLSDSYVEKSYHVIHWPVAQAVCGSVTLKTPKCTSAHLGTHTVAHNIDVQAHGSDALRRFAHSCFVPSMLCAQDQLWRGVTGPPLVDWSTWKYNIYTQARQWSRNVKKLQKRRCRARRSDNAACVSKHTLWNEGNGLGSQASVRACVRHLCLGLPRTAFCFCTGDEKKNCQL